MSESPARTELANRRRREAFTRDDSIPISETMERIGKLVAENQGDLDEDAPTLQEQHAKRAEDIRLGRMFPKMYRRMTFGSFKPQTVMQRKAGDVCQAFADRINAGESPPGLLLSGPPGRAKTHLGVSILRDVASVKTRTSRRVRVQICEVAEFLGDMRESYGVGDDSGRAILASMKGADVLLLDDVGAERETPWATEMLYGLVNHRAKHELTTILTTNIDPHDFARRADGVFPKSYGDDPIYCWRIYSRLRGMVVGSGALLDGPDGRKGLA